MAKTAINRKKAAKEFADFWKNKGDERQETACFWIWLLEKVLGMENPAERIEFEKKVQLKHTSFIDAYIPETKVLIEQKSSDVDLRKEAKQSDGAMLTPYRQAKRYADEMPNSLRPNWIVVCNFQEFLIYDMEKPQGEPVQVLLEELPDKFECLLFMIDTKKTSISPEEQISLKAGELVGKLYDAILKQYKNPESAETLKSLNILCVRLVFLLYAEDAGIFPEKDMFGRYLAKFQPDEVRKNLIELFSVLNTKPENRDPYLNDDLAAFPYVNGGLFAEREIEIPRFNAEIVDILVNKASAGFDWSEISPTIFGAVFESTINPETRRKGGMHYTSIANIHKVIDPLFLDDLKKEFYEICGASTKLSNRQLRSLSKVEVNGISAKQRSNLEEFRNKIASLKFLDPACGSGNFLTETYISLRRLENEILKIIHGSQQLLGSNFSPIKVKISQFYGIEINDFAVTVAKTALWIAESQMMKETEEIVEENLDFLPLSTSATIVEGNALHIDWSTLEEEKSEKFVYADKLNVYKVGEKSWENGVHEPEIPYGAHFQELNVATKEITEKKFPEKNSSKSVIYDYIIGNPPFVGYTFQTETQKKDLKMLDKDIAKNIDYVAGWYFKAAKLIQNTTTKVAFVSTNSITQGEQVAIVWKPLFEKYGVNIDFAWQTFKWANETSDKKNMAAVHCVIIGFSTAESSKPKIIFVNEDEKIEAKNINGYLLGAKNIFIEKRMRPLCDSPQICLGSSPLDGGNLILSEEEKEKYLKKEPQGEKFLRSFMMGKDFIDRKPRWCFWLMDANPTELRKCHEIMRRIENVRKFRLMSNRSSTLRSAEMPTLFGAPFIAESDYVAIPKVSSENRRYIPMDYLSKEIVPGDKLFVMQHATLYHFGVLTSSVHMAWMRAVCGRLEMRYSYSNTIVYNNFPWPFAGMHAARVQKTTQSSRLHADIETTAQAILDIRAKYPDSSLADLYDERTMPPDLRKAHKENDKAVMAAYGFDPKMSEAEIVAELFKMYEKLTEK